MGLFSFLFPKRNKQSPGAKEQPVPDNEAENLRAVAPSSIDIETNIGSNKTAVDQVYPIYTSIEGFSVGKVLLLNWCNYRDVNTPLPGYFTSLYGINPLRERADLLKEGFLTIGRHKDGLKALKVTELKRILKSSGMKQTGRKADLLERIATDVPEDKYADSVPKVSLATSQGNQILSQCSILIWAQKNSSKYAYFTPNDFVEDLPTDGMTESDMQKTALKKINSAMFEALSQHQLQFAASIAHGYQVLAIAADIPFDEWSPYFVTSTALGYLGYVFYSDYDHSFSFDVNSQTIPYLQGQVQDVAQQFTLGTKALESALAYFNHSISNYLPSYLRSIGDDVPMIITSMITDTPADAQRIATNYKRQHIPKNFLREY